MPNSLTCKALVRTASMALAAAAMTLLAPAGAAAKPPFIAMSNAYYGNNWRHQMVDTFRKAADQAKKDGLISGYVVLNGDNSVHRVYKKTGTLACPLVVSRPFALVLCALCVLCVLCG